jgi:hypothetical protein
VSAEALSPNAGSERHLADVPAFDAPHPETQRQIDERGENETRSGAREGRVMSSAQLYDTIGATYTVTRRTEPRIAGSERARSEDTELIALGIGQHNPRLLALPDVRSRGPQRKQPFDLNVSVVWPEVEVQPILHRLRVRDRDEEEPGQTISSRSDLELVWVVIDNHPAQRLPPPTAEGAWVSRIHDRLLPLEAHASILESARPACPETPARRRRKGSLRVGRLAHTGAVPRLVKSRNK